MANIDLNAARAARAEGYDEPKSITFGDPPQSFALPDECPMKVATMWGEGDFLGGLQRLLGDEQFERWEALEPSTKDVELLAEELGKVYTGGDAGESLASVSSSSNGSSRPRRTSSASTG